VLTSLFVEWSHVKNISFLDSACCNKTDRIIFLNLLKHEFVVLGNEEMRLISDPVANIFMKYVFTRGIKLSRLLVNPYCISRNMLFPFDHVLSYMIDVSFVKTLQISGEDFSDCFNFAGIINSFVNLKQLILINLFNRSYETNNGFFDNLRYLNQFTCIQISKMGDNMSPFVWQTIAKECTNLEHFTFKLDETEFDYFLTNSECKVYLSELLQNNLALTTIEMNLYEISEDGNDVFAGDAAVDLFEILTNSCPSNIEFCTLSCIGTFNVRHFITCILNFKKLKQLDIQKYDDVHERCVFYRRSSDVKQLHLEGFSDPFIEPYSDYVISNIKCLFDLIVGFTHIDFTNMLSFSDKLLCFISKQNLTTLICLTVGSCGVGYSYASIVECLSICKVLKCLHMIDCPHFSDDDFLALCCPVNMLTDLSILNAPCLTTKTLLLLIDRSKSLLILNVHNCINVDRLVVDEYCTNVLFINEPYEKGTYIIY
jgi:hypothetical protein